MPRKVKGVGQITENKRHKRSLLFKPARPAELCRQRKSPAGQQALLDDVSIEHLIEKKPN